MAAAKLSQRILDHLQEQPGCSDRELTDSLVGRGRPLLPVNTSCRAMSAQGLITRSMREDGVLGNFLPGQIVPIVPEQPKLDGTVQEESNEEDVKQVLQQWLESQSYMVERAMARSHGIDIEAVDCAGKRPRWIIEVKGFSSKDPVNSNFFLSVLGEALQRMSDSSARYSIALPDTKRYRHLWESLPTIAKERTGITCLLIAAGGKIAILD